MRRYFVSKLKPPSAQAKRNPEYVEEVRKEAIKHHPEYSPEHPGHKYLTGDLYARIVYLYNGKRYKLDVDNISKRLIDAFKKHFYDDDEIIVHLSCTKMNYAENDIVIGTAIKAGIPINEDHAINRYLSQKKNTILYFELGQYRTKKRQGSVVK